MRQISQQDSPIQIGERQVAIAVCTFANAFLHLYTAIQPGEDFRFWFLLNGLGYLGLLIVFFLPRFAPRHHIISFLLVGYALLTIVLWFLLAPPDEIVIYITNVIGLVLAVLASYEGWRALRVRGMGLAGNPSD